MDKNLGGTFWKAIATIVVWVMVLGGFIFTGVFLAPQMGEDSLGAIFMLLAAAVVTSGFVWNWGSTGQSKQVKQKARDEAEMELYELAVNAGRKRKRDGLSDRLSRLSDAELVNLREQLRRGEIDEEDLASILGGGNY